MYRKVAEADIGDTSFSLNEFQMNNLSAAAQELKHTIDLVNLRFAFKVLHHGLAQLQ